MTIRPTLSKSHSMHNWVHVGQQSADISGHFHLRTKGGFTHLSLPETAVFLESLSDTASLPGYPWRRQVLVPVLAPHMSTHAETGEPE